MNHYQCEHSIQTVLNVHDESVCNGSICPIHNKTHHSMRSFPQYWRGDRGFFERTCPHGIGHPDPDNIMPDRYGQSIGTHGCDGCCYDPTKEHE